MNACLHSNHISDFADLHFGARVSNRRNIFKAYRPEGIKTLTEGFEQSYSIDSTFSKIISNIFCWF